MITHNHLYGEICSFENLLWAARRAERGKRMQDTVGRFRTDLEAELLRLRRELVVAQSTSTNGGMISVTVPRQISSRHFWHSEGCATNSMITPKFFASFRRWDPVMIPG